jgi:hypothetical protein
MGPGVAVRGTVAPHVPNRSCMLRSQPRHQMPVRSSDVSSRRPRPVRSRSSRAVTMPATVVMAVTWSPIPPRKWSCGWSVGTASDAMPDRAQNPPTS